ncbi:MAG: hypothetical protein DMG40_12350 [Acidobacteria bacterium]|nr:MAG: hypothetical protein DMG40_12350 [Acidobacteriota bacterium]
MEVRRGIPESENGKAKLGNGERNSNLEIPKLKLLWKLEDRNCEKTKKKTRNSVARRRSNGEAQICTI